AFSAPPSTLNDSAMTVPALSLKGSSSWALSLRIRSVPAPALVNDPPCDPPPMVGRLAVVPPPRVSVTPLSMLNVPGRDVVAPRAAAAERIDCLMLSVQQEAGAGGDVHIGDVRQRRAGVHRQAAADGDVDHRHGAGGDGARAAE